MPMTDIRQITENTKGDDIFVGDIHGCLKQLQDVVARLGVDDRLFIVGDLTDRGPSSFAVIQEIIKHNTTKKFEQIIVVRGNHEELLLGYCQLRLKLESQFVNPTGDMKADCIKLMENVTSECIASDAALAITKLTLEKAEQRLDDLQDSLDSMNISYDVENSSYDIKRPMSEWLQSKSKEYQSEYSELVTQVAKASHVYDEMKKKFIAAKNVVAGYQYRLDQLDNLFEEFQKVYDRLHDYDSPEYFGRTKLWADDLTTAELTLISAYITNLPYIISGPNFNVVHADLPMSNKILKDKISQGDLSLTQAEKYHAVYARIGDKYHPIPKKHESLVNTPLTIAGHTIGGGVRADSNTIVLDVGTFESNATALLHLKKKQVELIGDPTKKIGLKRRIAKDLIADLNAHVQSWARANTLPKVNVAQHTRQFSSPPVTPKSPAPSSQSTPDKKCNGDCPATNMWLQWIATAKRFAASQ